MELLPVGKLSPSRDPWATQVRVAYLSPARYWKGVHEEGYVLAAEFVGNDGVRFRACAFDESAKQFAASLKFNCVFRVSHASLRSSRQEYTSIPHQFEIVLTPDARVEAVEDDGGIAETPVSITRIRDLVTKPAGSLVNVSGVLVQIGEIRYIQTRKGGTQLKRDVILVDESNTSVMCTIWDDYADDRLDTALHLPILAYQCRLTEFGGRSLSTARSSMIDIDPPTSDAEQQRSWFCQTRGDGCLPLSLVDCRFTRLAEIRNMRGGQPVAVIGVITRVSEEVAMERSGRELLKREVTLEDIEGTQMKCTLWQQDARNVNMETLHHVLAVEYGKVDTYDGVAIGTSSATQVVLDPAIPAGWELQTAHIHNSPQTMSCVEHGNGGNESEKAPDATGGPRRRSAVRGAALVTVPEAGRRS